MHKQKNIGEGAILLAACCTAGGFTVWGGRMAMAQDASIGPPVNDRWMYPFASQAGSRPTAPTFASLGTCGTDDRFDDRDAQFLVIFNTSGAFAPGQPPASYDVAVVRLSVSVDTDVSFGTPFQYDPTYDAVATYFAPGDVVTPCAADPALVADADAGRPIELFAVAFRNGFTATSYLESSPFKPGSAFTPPWYLTRNAYPVFFGSTGGIVDASNHVKERVEVSPLAIGTIAGAVAGDFPVDGAVVTFTLDLSQPGVRQYVQEGLAAGRVALMVTSMFFAQQEALGSYPTFYTREGVSPSFPNATAPSLFVSVGGTATCAPDFNGDGTLDPDDLADYISAYFSVPPSSGSDYNGDGLTDPDDLADYIGAFFAGC